MTAGRVFVQSATKSLRLCGFKFDSLTEARRENVISDAITAGADKRCDRISGGRRKRKSFCTRPLFPALQTN